MASVSPGSDQAGHAAGQRGRHWWSIVAVILILLVAMVSGIWLPADAWGAPGQWAGAFGTVLAVTVAL